MKNFPFSPWNYMGYKTNTAILQDRRIFKFNILWWRHLVV